MIRCIIVDDEPLARALLQSYVQRVDHLTCVATCENATEAFGILQQQEIDLVLLDIQMPGITGLQLLKSLRIYPRIIFTTAYPDHAVEAFELDAVDYLVKPITYERFLKAVQKLAPNMTAPAQPTDTQAPTYIFLKVNKRLVKIDHSDILYVESLGDYFKVYTAAKTFVTNMTLGKLETLLPESMFIRIHRSTIVNLLHVSYAEGNTIRVLDKDLAIGITYKAALLQKLKGRV